MEVVGSDNHILVSNMEGVASVPPPLGYGLCQKNTGRPLRHQKDDKLKACSTDVVPSLLVKDIVPYQYPASTSPTKI